MTIFNSSGAGVPGRAASITTKLAKDDTASAVTVTVTEIDSSNLPGWYKVAYTPSSTGHWVCTAIDTANMTAPWLDEIQATTSDLYALVLDSSGRPGVDWSNVGAQGTTVVLANTLIEGVIGSVGAVAGGVGGDVAGDVQGKLLGGGSSSLSAVAAKVDLQTWRGDTPSTIDVGNGGLIYVDVAAWKGGVPNGLTSGKVQSDVQSWLGSVPNALVGGNLLVDLRKWIGLTPNGLDLSGDVKVFVDVMSSSVATQIGYAVWEELVSAHTTASTFGKLLGAITLTAAGNVKADLEEWRASVPNALASGRVDASVGAIVAATVAAASFAADALGAIASAALTRDIALDETGAPQHSLLGAVQKLTCPVDASSGTSLIVQKTDGSTAWTQPITTSPTANPIVAAG